MRDRRFVAEHRGGLLNMEHHRLLMSWSCVCVEHVLELYGSKPDERILSALKVGRSWVAGEAKVGDARKASVDLLALAREMVDPVQIALVRAAGHAVATAHMADHSMGGALYAIKAVNCAGKSMEEERHWQVSQLPLDVKDFVLDVMHEKRLFRINEVKMEPRLEELQEKILVGKRMDMCFAELKTYDLWHGFMPIMHLITNRLGDELYSVEVYSRNFFREYDERALFQKWAAVEVADFADVPEVFETQIVPKGLYAVFTHKGSSLKAPDTYHFIFHEWLPFSEMLLDDRPHLAIMGEKYKGDSEDSEEEIWIPVRKQ